MKTLYKCRDTLMAQQEDKYIIIAGDIIIGEFENPLVAFGVFIEQVDIKGRRSIVKYMQKNGMDIRKIG